MNPNMPAFVTFYNGYFQERSKMNMKMMDMMLRQATPEYLTNLIERTQNNIEELQKQKADILESAQQERIKIASANTRNELSRQKANLNVRNRGLMDEKDRVLGTGKKGGSSGADRLAKAEQRYKTDVNEVEALFSNEEKALDVPTLKSELNSDLDRLIAYDLLQNDESVRNIVKNRKLKNRSVSDIQSDLLQMIKGVNNSTEAKAELERQKNIKYDAFATSAVPTQDKDQLEELGYNLTPKERTAAMEYLNKDGTKKKDFPTDPTKLENVKKQQKYLIQTKSGGGIGKLSTQEPTDYQAFLDEIQKDLDKETAKLQGYYTRFDLSRQNVIDEMFTPFDSNYRTENLFKRKSPEVLQQEEKMRELQYRDRNETPKGYSNIEYNTEYAGLGGLNFGITKIGEEDVPYIFEKGTPYEIEKSDPSYSYIIELLEEQDKKLGGE
jgi:hypothetical protein|tara:strand:+ start:9823 stop:11142 length:1320 start_codon:yes stop_codon:yes gene_type:complete